MQLYQIYTEPVPTSMRRLKSGHIQVQGGRLPECKLFDWTLPRTCLWEGLVHTSPFRCKQQKAVVKMKNKDDHCLRWVLPLFPVRSHVHRPTMYPSDCSPGGHTVNTSCTLKTPQTATSPLHHSRWFWGCRLFHGWHPSWVITAYPGWMIFLAGPVVADLTESVVVAV